MIHPSGLKRDIEKAVANGKVMEIIADLDFMNRQLKRPVKEVLNELKRDDEYEYVDEDEYDDMEEWEGEADFF
jgi:hypothetical protein